MFIGLTCESVVESIKLDLFDNCVDKFCEVLSISLEITQFF